MILRHPIPRAIAAIRPSCRRPVVYRHRAVVAEQHRPLLARGVREKRGQQDGWTWQRAVGSPGREAHLWSVLARILNPTHEQNRACGLVIQEKDEGTGRVDQ